ncbi:MAG: hypothetical protein JOZ57_06950 [Abitibacteriaceae bacterium]|nr:hypothetical protein [Abditibacteriaceae bacterium]
MISPRPFRCTICAIVCAVVGLWPVATAQAQLGPQVYALSHFFGATRTATVRGYGMGGAVACIPGPDSLNPADAADNKQVAADVRHLQASFTNSTTFKTNMVSVALPLGANGGGQILYSNVKSPTHSSFLATAFPGSTQKLSEESVGLFYGHRINPKLALGVSAAPVLATHHVLGAIGAPGIDIHFDGRPIVSQFSKLGGRVGLDYKFAEWGRFGLIYDNFWERATMTVPPALAPAGLVTHTANFHAVNLAGGFNIQPTKKLTLVFEHDKGSLTGDGSGITGHETYAGAEWMVASALALRVGRRNGNSTYGLGVTRGNFSLQWAYVNNLAADQVNPVFGGRHNLKNFEVGYSF